jgi:hypothetical protein
MRGPVFIERASKSEPAEWRSVPTRARIARKLNGMLEFMERFRKFVNIVQQSDKPDNENSARGDAETRQKGTQHGAKEKKEEEINRAQKRAKEAPPSSPFFSVAPRLCVKIYCLGRFLPM